MRIVLDTNVLISGIFFTGPPNALLTAWKNKRIQIVISPDIFDEYNRVAKIILQKYPGTNISEILNMIAIHSELIQPTPLPSQICDDPDDDKFIACALSGHIRYIVSGDKHLFIN